MWSLSSKHFIARAPTPRLLPRWWTRRGVEGSDSRNELRARFDEAENIELASTLQERAWSSSMVWWAIKPMPK